MDIVLFGMQGSGKGTQARLISKRYDLDYFETGAELRRLSKENSILGKKVKSIIDAGHLVENEIVMEIVENFVEHTKPDREILFDGIPRSFEQDTSLKKLLSSKGRTFKAVVIEISENEALKRLSKRQTCPGCKTAYPASHTSKICETCQVELEMRIDDTPDAIKTRIEAYTRETMPVIELYKQKGDAIIINGEQSIGKVTDDLYQKLGELS